MSKTHDYSLRRRLLVRLWGPLFLVLTLSAAGAFMLARHIGTAVHDRWLFDSAMTLAQQTKHQGGRAVLDLPRPAIEMFEWDSVDRIFEEVTSRKNGAVFSSARFPAPPDDLTAGKPRYSDGMIDGQPTRIVTLLVKSPGDDDAFVIQVAETMRKRHSLVAEIIWFLVPLQIFVLVMAGAAIWFAVTSSLRAIDRVAARLAAYGPEKLLAVGDAEQAPVEVKPLLHSINRLIAKLADAHEMQRRFISNASHQLRTPLATLQVQVERALREPDPIRHSEALSHVLTALTRSRHVVQQLLTLARSERSGEPRLHMVEVDLAELARDELEQWVDEATSRHVDIGYEGPERGVTLCAEPNLLRELIGNLVGNAIRHGRVGGVVTLGLRTSPIALTVDDDGPGIPVEERTLVIERFYRRPVADSDGSGLGLSIVWEIAARHGASLSILDNPQGRGTRVEVLFDPSGSGNTDGIVASTNQQP